MKKLCAILLLITAAQTFPLLHSISEQETYPTSIIKLKRTPLINNFATVRALYHGNILPFQAGQCILTNRERRPFYALIITKRIIMKKNGPHFFMERAPEESCSWYNLSLYCSVDPTKKNENTWIIKKLRDEEMPLRLPDDSSIIVLLPGNFVQGLNNTTTPGTYTLHLPEIELKKEISQQALNDAANEAALHMLDYRAIFSTPQQNVAQNDRSIIISQEKPKW